MVNHRSLPGMSTRQLIPLGGKSIDDRCHLAVVHQAPGAALRPAGMCQLLPFDLFGIHPNAGVGDRP
jgi:hypothetical protein